jgi:nickel/cobalt exporter
MKISRPLLVALATCATIGVACAQARHPFAVGAGESGAPGGAIGLWLIEQQAHVYRLLTGAVRATRDSATAFWTLAGLSFAYGIFHAAGPGHGKAVMASYMVANERALGRGLVLTGAAALLQAIIAIGIVGILALILGATAARMTDAASAIETASYLAVAALGAWLVWTKGRALIVAFASFRPTPALAFANADGSAKSAFVCEAVDPHHVHDASCGHFHAPDPATLGDGFSWMSALATIVAAGARPCSGAILVLVFALAQGVFIVGVGAALFMGLGTALTTGGLAALAVFAKKIAMRLVGADTGRGALVARGAEFVAALFVLAVGLALLFGSTFAQGVV